MKKSLRITVLTTLPLFTPLAWADDAHHSDKDKKPATAMTDKGKQVQMGKMQGNMMQMHEQMHKIMDMKHPQERERLMQQHSKMMQDMSMMQGMMGGDAKGGKMDSGMACKDTYGTA